MITKFDKNIIEQYIENGWLIRQWHPTLDLQILNYSKATEYGKKWDDITRACRGIVLNKDYEVVFPCMGKFFNNFQLDIENQKRIANWSKNDYILTEKMDGCMGLIGVYEGEIVCASRGSFDSFVTKEMYKMIKDVIYANDLETIKTCFIVEVICPETHILVDYGQKRELRVITSFRCDKENNDYFEWSFEETKKLVDTINNGKETLFKPVKEVNMSILELLKWQKEHDFSEEGFVARNIKTNERVKFKSDDYLRVASAKANCDFIHICNNALELFNDRKDWSLYENGKWLDKLYEMGQAIPDELMDAYSDICLSLYAKTEFIYDKIFMISQKYKDLEDKELGLKAKEDKELKKYLPLVFNIRKNRPFDRVLIEMAKQEYKDWLELPADERERITQERQKRFEEHKERLEQWRKEQNNAK